SGTTDFGGRVRPLAQVELTEVGPTSSKAKVLRRGDRPIELASRAVERVHKYQNDPIRVFFDPNSFNPATKGAKPIASPTRDAVRRRIESAKQLAASIRLVDEARDEDLALRPGSTAQGGDAVVLSEKGRAELLMSFPADDPKAAGRAVEKIREWA